MHTSLPPSRKYYALAFSMSSPLSISRAPAQKTASTNHCHTAAVQRSCYGTATQLQRHCNAASTTLQRSCCGTCADPAVHSCHSAGSRSCEAVDCWVCGGAAATALLLPSSVSLGSRHTRANVGRQGLPAATARAEDTAAEDEAHLGISTHSLKIPRFRNRKSEITVQVLVLARVQTSLPLQREKK